MDPPTGPAQSGDEGAKVSKPHKHAGTTLELVTQLPLQEIAASCDQAAAEVHVGMLGAGGVRLEEATPHRLVFGMRGPGGLLEMMTFEVRVECKAGEQYLSTHILSYRTRQDTIGGIIPTGPKTLIGIKGFRKFNEACAQNILARDPSAEIFDAGTAK
jgi:hypothetical protein